MYPEVYLGSCLEHRQSRIDYVCYWDCESLMHSVWHICTELEQLILSCTGVSSVVIGMLSAYNDLYQLVFGRGWKTAGCWMLCQIYGIYMLTSSLLAFTNKGKDCSGSSSMRLNTSLTLTLEQVGKSFTTKKENGIKSLLLPLLTSSISTAGKSHVLSILTLPAWHGMWQQLYGSWKLHWQTPTL